MPLRERNNLREKILLLGPAGAGKTTAHLSIAWWAFQSGDQRRFWVLDTDDEAVLQVMDEPKYEGMLASVNGDVIDPNGNVHIFDGSTWKKVEAFRDYVMKEVRRGDWVVFDFITQLWTEAQEGFLQDAWEKSRGTALYEQGVKGKSGWEMFSEDFNWNAINGSYFDVLKDLTIKSGAHIFQVAEEEVLDPDARKKTEDQKEHLAQFGKYKAKGQKRLPYACRSYLRTVRLARGRVLQTNGKDRARKEFDGDVITPDFCKMYLVGAAGWEIADE